MSQMNIVELEIFEQTSDYCELRLSTGGGPPKTRGLDLAAIDHLIDVVEHDYSQHAIAQKVFGSPQLRELGAKLGAFLDGDERWLTPAVEDPHGTTLRITAAQRWTPALGTPCHRRLLFVGCRPGTTAAGAGDRHQRRPRDRGYPRQSAAAGAVYGFLP